MYKVFCPTTGNLEVARFIEDYINNLAELQEIFFKQNENEMRFLMEYVRRFTAEYAEKNGYEVKNDDA